MTLDKEYPKEVIDKAYEAVESARKSGKIKKGVNEATKAIERGTAKLVVTAKDVNPKEIVMHLPALCEEKSIPFVVVNSKDELGAAAGLTVGTTCVAIVQEGDAKAIIKQIAEKL